MEQDKFHDLLKALLKKGRARSLEEIVECYRSGRAVPPKTFVVTFDDGFQNNLTVAAPVLRDLGVPATFYFSTEMIENNSQSWIDSIESILEKTEKGKFELPFYGKKYVFAHRDDKISILKDLRVWVKREPSVNTDALVDQLRQQLSVSLADFGEREIDQKLSWEEVKTLARDPLFTVGGHSHRHLNMAFLSEKECEKEIDLSLHLLKEKAGVAPRHYSYPEGLENCYSPSVIECLRSRGIVCSPTAIDGVNPVKGQASDLFHLKRVMALSSLLN